MRISLRSKWALALALTALIPLTALSFRTQAIQRRALADNERALEGSIVRQASMSLGDELDRVAAATLRVVALVSDARVADPELRLILAKDVVASESRLERLAVYTADGALVFAAGVQSGPPAPDLLGATAFAGARAWRLERTTGKPRFRYHVNVTQGAQVTGHVLAWVDASFLDARVEGLSTERFERRDCLTLVDSDLMPIAGSMHPDTVHAAVQASGIHGDITDKPLEITRSFSDRGIATVGTVLPLPDFGAVLITARPEHEAFASLVRARREFGTTMGAATLCALLLAYALSASTTRPIARLTELTRAYARREFGTRSNIQTGDELEGLGNAMEEMADGLRAGEEEIDRRARVEIGLSRFMPEAVAKAIASSESDVVLGGVRKDISVVFADVVGFTQFAERAPPEQVSALLNELFGLLSETVFRNGGVVDKFMGDCVMALFGATDDDAKHPSQALACAEDMHRFVASNRAAWSEQHGFEIHLGIGCATGIAVVGNLGSARRMEFTAIGDPVNVAARLESLARPGQTLCTQETAARAPEFPTRSRGTHPLRGKSEAVEVFELEDEG